MSRIVEISLNPKKTQKGSNDLALNRLDIPIHLDSSKKFEFSELSGKLLQIDFHPLLQNSNASLSFNYSFGLTQVIASLQGPTEARFSSKKDYSKCYIELNLNDTSNNQNFRNLNQMKSQLKGVLEQIIKATNYPLTIFTFQLVIVQDLTDGTQVFAALTNACIALLNSAGIQIRSSGFAAMSIVVEGQKKNQMRDVGEEASVDYYCKDGVNIKNQTIIDLVMDSKSGFIYWNQQGKECSIDALCSNNDFELKLSEIYKSLINQLTF